MHPSGKPQDSPREPFLHLPRPGKRRNGGGDTQYGTKRDTTRDNMGHKVGRDLFTCPALGNGGTGRTHNNGTKRDTTWDTMGHNGGRDSFACLASIALGNGGAGTQYGTKLDTTWDKEEWGVRGGTILLPLPRPGRCRTDRGTSRRREQKRANKWDNMVHPRVRNKTDQHENETGHDVGVNGTQHGTGRGWTGEDGMGRRTLVDCRHTVLRYFVPVQYQHSRAFLLSRC